MHTNIPSELTELKQWVLWRLEKNEKGDYTKIPYQISGVKAKTTDPSNWDTFDIVSKKSKNYSGIGFVFTELDTYIGIDLDKCIVDGKIEKWAMDIIKMFDSYTEISQGGIGIHIIIKGKLPQGCGNRKGQIEVYEKERYFCMTGKVLENMDTIQSRQESLEIVLKQNGLLKETIEQQSNNSDIPVILSERACPFLTDEQVIEKASNAINGSKFVSLFGGDTGSFGSESEADMSLVNHIAFYTQDVNQILNIVKKSPLWDKKWEREDYQKRTIEKVLSTMTEFYKPGTKGNGKDKSKNAESSVSVNLEADNKADSKSKKKKGDSQATILVKLCQLNNVRLWHTADKQPMVTFVTNKHCENWLTGSKTFKAYLQRLYYQHYKTAPGKQSVSDAINVIDGMALFDGIEQNAFVRLAYADNKVYLDLANDTWQVVEIDSSGWRVLGNSPIVFRRGRGMLALPTPTQQGNLGALFDIFHVEVKEQILIMSWLIGAMNQRGPFPILVVNGEQGSGKSTLCKLLKNTMDPGIATLKSLPREERDLFISANNSWLLSYDNISGLPDWISDAMCRLSTGGGFSIRELYSDSEEMIFDVKRPIILNGIENMGLRGDFSDRAILMNLPTIESKGRLDEKSMDAKFSELHPTILGGLCDTVSTALKNIDSVKLDVVPRMADFALWITASEQALGVMKLVKLYQENRDEQSEIVLGASLVGTAIVDFMATRTLWEGTLRQLLDELDTVVDVVKRKEKTYPKDPIRLSSKLRRDAPQLRQAGINITFEGHSMKGNLVKIEKS